MASLAAGYELDSHSSLDDSQNWEKKVANRIGDLEFGKEHQRNGEYGTFVPRPSPLSISNDNLLNSSDNGQRARPMSQPPPESKSSIRARENTKPTKRSITPPGDNVKHERSAHEVKQERRNTAEKAPASKAMERAAEMVIDPYATVDEMLRDIPKLPAKLGLTDDSIAQLERDWRESQRPRSPEHKNHENTVKDVAMPDLLPQVKKKENSPPSIIRFKIKTSNTRPVEKKPEPVQNNSEGSDDDISFDDEPAETHKSRNTIPEPPKEKKAISPIRFVTKPKVEDKPVREKKKPIERRRTPKKVSTPPLTDADFRRELDRVDITRKSPNRRSPPPVVKPSKSRRPRTSSLKVKRAEEKPKQRVPKVTETVIEISVPVPQVSVSEPFVEKRKRQRSNSSASDKSPTNKKRKTHHNGNQTLSTKQRRKLTAAELQDSADSLKRSADAMRNKKEPAAYLTVYLTALLKYIEAFDQYDPSNPDAKAIAFRSISQLASFTAKQGAVNSLPRQAALANLIWALGLCQSFLVSVPRFTSLYTVYATKKNMQRPEELDSYFTNKRKDAGKLLDGMGDVLRMMNAFEKAKHYYKDEMPVEQAFALTVPPVVDFVRDKLNEIENDSMT